MVRNRFVPAILCATAWLGVSVMSSPSRAADKPKPTSGVVSGIVIDKSDKGEKSITVRPDGADEPVEICLRR